MKQTYTDKSIIIMNFSGVYKEEPFASNPRFTHLDCSHLHGTDCYCDAEGAKSIQNIIAPYPAEGIHFIDSGDYHYVTKFWTDKINKPFSFVLFDHHTDMQPSRWGEMLSCGGWVKDIADNNKLLRRIYLLGISKEQAASIPARYKGRVIAVTEEKLHAYIEGSKTLLTDTPLYISIDKDVLDTKSAYTNWNQGSLTLDDLKRLLSLIMKRGEIIGIDICGECPVTLRLYPFPDSPLAIDNKANRELLSLFRRQGLF